MEIQVFLTRGSEKPVYQRIVSQNTSVKADFQLLLEAMRILYGSQCMVVFKVVD